MKRFRQSPTIGATNLRINLGSSNLNPIGLWFPAKEISGKEIKYLIAGGRCNHHRKYNDKHISSLLKHMRMKNEKI